MGNKLLGKKGGAAECKLNVPVCRPPVSQKREPEARRAGRTVLAGSGRALCPAEGRTSFVIRGFWPVFVLFRPVPLSLFCRRGSGAPRAAARPAACGFPGVRMTVAAGLFCACGGRLNSASVLVACLAVRHMQGPRLLHGQASLRAHLFLIFVPLILGVQAGVSARTPVPGNWGTGGVRGGCCRVRPADRSVRAGWRVGGCGSRQLRGSPAVCAVIGRRTPQKRLFL